MTAIVNVTKLLFKRGNTAQNAAYTGINGEITVDTQAKTLRVHDGVTTGGNIVTAGAMASYIPTDPTITSIQANVAAANAAISAITGIDTSLLANAATQQTQIDVLNANVDTINANIGAFQTYANATATTVANLTNGASTVSLSTDGNLTLPGGGLLGQVYGDGIDTELTIKSPPGVGDSGYVALASANEQNYVEVNNTGIVLGVEFGQAGFKTWTFDTDGVLTAPGNIVLLNGAVIKDTVGGAVAFGVNAGLNSQGIEAIAIGLGAGSDTQGNNAIAIGEAAGNNTQGIEAVAIGRGAGAITQGNRSVAISIGAGATGQSGDAIAIGYNAGTTSQGIAAVAIGQLAGQTSQSGGAVAIGFQAGADTQNISAVAIGAQAGENSQGQYSVAIGDLAGTSTQGNNSVAIGTTAGQTSQGDRAVAIGLRAGETSQGVGGVAIGEQAGQTSQGVLSVAVGYLAGSNAQSFSAVAIGAQAGETTQGSGAIAIGDLAGQTNQASNSIIINATGVALNQTTANTFTVAPVRNDVANVGEVMFYNTTSKEITYGNTISIAGNITTSNLTFPDSTTQTTAFTTSPTLNVLKIDDGVHEKFQTKVDATGVVTHDCSLGHIIYHTSPDDYFTVNLTNLDLASGYATSITVVMEQGATGYGPNALQIGGVAQTINWQGGSLPAAPTANGVDVVTFSILNNSGTYTVLGQVTGFNEVP